MSNEKIFYNGKIYSLKERNDSYEAFFTKNGEIVAIGKNDEILKLKNDKVELIDLGGKVILPSFINLSSNIVSLAQSLMFCDLSESKSADGVKRRIESFINLNKYSDNDLVLCMGLDDSVFSSKDINKDFLNSISDKLSIIITNQKGDAAILNDYIISNIFKKEKNLDGIKFPNNGLVDGEQFLKIIPFVPNKKLEDILKALKIAQNIFLSFGITTVQDNISLSKELNVLTTAATNKELEIDLVAHLDVNEFKSIFPMIKDKLVGYSRGFRIGGLKIDIDGPLETKNSLISIDYLNNDSDDKKLGSLSFNIEEIKKSINWSIDMNTQLFISATGNKAISNVIDYLQSKDLSLLKNFINRRPIANTLIIDSKDILRMKMFNISVCQFASHIWHFGDMHSQNIDTKLMDNFMCIKTLDDKGLHPSCFQDSLLVKPNLFESIWCIVNRKTHSSIVLNENEKLDVFDALKTITINPAYQLHEESKKGTLEVNKFADFVVLNEDPFEIESGYLSSVKVLETYKRAKLLWKR